MPRWMYPSIDAKAKTQQNTDVYNAVNWFYRNVHDPAVTVNKATLWQLFSAAWDKLGYEFSAASGYADYPAVIGADILNEPCRAGCCSSRTARAGTTPRTPPSGRPR
jgi:hypothetical protein